MSEKALDLRGSVRIVRRHARLVAAVAAVGLLLGGAYSTLKPPQLTSTALIVLPQSTQAASAAAAQSSGSSSPYTATQAVIVRSTPVLTAALSSARPAMSLDALRADIQVNSLTTYILSISAGGKSGSDAEATANAVANSYIAYVNSSNSPIQQVSARLLQSATTATGENRWVALAISALIGALAGALIGILVALAISRKDQRLWKRDEIANSIGVPVIASFPVRHPRDAAGWTELLENYEPAARDAWRIRQALQQLGIPESVDNAILNNGSSGGGSSLTVLSLAGDPGAIALGPQLAVLAALQGIPTTLIVGQQEDPAAAATLRAACGMPSSESSKRPSTLQVIADYDASLSERFRAALTVYVAVVEGQALQLPRALGESRMILGVSAGAATAEQIAEVAINAATHGHVIAGILVADPEPADQTTGLVPQLARPTRHGMPTRLGGKATEIRQ